MEKEGDDGGKTEGKRKRIGAKFGTRWEIDKYVPQQRS